MSLPEALERAASALEDDADSIRPSNGDPLQLLQVLSAEAALRVLTWVLTNEPEAADELLDTWSREPAGIAPLQAIDEASLPKPGRKLLRRALHALRSRGVELPSERAAPEARVGRLPDIEDKIEGAAVSPLDPRGGRVAYLVEANSTGGARLFEIMVDEARGILECQVYAGGRSGIRGFLRQVTESKKGMTVPAEPASVRALVARCAEAQDVSRPPPRDFLEWRSHLSAHDGARAPGELAVAHFSADPSPSVLRSAADLVSANEIGPWPPENEELDALATRIRELRESPIIVSGTEQRARLDDLLGDAAADLYGASFAEVTARRLEESAYVMWKKKEDEKARVCVSSAAAFRTLPANDNPVARALLEVMLAPLLTRLREEDDSKEKDEDEGSVLVKP